MKTTTLLKTLGILVHCSSFAQNFTASEPVNVQGIIYGDVKWIDINKDHHQELIICGQSADYNDTTVIVNNNLDTLKLNQTTNFTALTLASLTTADLNNDGYEDCIMTGSNTASSTYNTIILMNDTNGGFTEQTTNMSGVISGKIKTGLINDDNLVDVILSGIDANYNYVTKLYFQDNSGQFTEQNTTLFGNCFGDITIFDVNNNGFQDVLLTGFDTTYAPNSKLYINDGLGNLTELSNSGISKFYFSATSVADYDNDNDLDLLINGIDAAYTAKSYIYKNDGQGHFVADNSVNFQNSYFGTADFIDADADGDWDVFIGGQDDTGTLYSNYYTNNAGIYTIETDISDTIIDVNISSTSWADYDNDMDLDLVITGMNSNGNIELYVYTNDLYDINPDLDSLPISLSECTITITPPTANNGQITATTIDPLTYTIQGNYTVIWTYTNGGHTETQIQNIILNDMTNPIEDQQELDTIRINCNESITTIPTATDNCAGSILGTTTDPLTYISSGTYTIMWTFTDDNDNLITQNQTVIISCESNNINENSPHKINIYPNPTNGIITIDNKNNSVIRAVITNTNGQIVETINQIDIGKSVIELQLPKGMYFLKVDGEIIKTKIIIN